MLAKHFFRAVLMVIWLPMTPVWAQEDSSERPQDAPSTATEPASSQSQFPTRFRLQVLEDESTPEERGRRIEQAHEWLREDLIAQQQMSEALAGLQRTAQDVRTYSLLSTLLTGLGAVFILAAAVLVIRANRTADQRAKTAQEIAVAEKRAYLFDVESRFDWSFDAGAGEPFVENIQVTWRNAGDTPARRCALVTNIHGLVSLENDPVIEECATSLDRQRPGHLDVLPNGNREVDGQGLSVDETRAWIAGEYSLIIHNFATYVDVFDRVNQTESCLVATCAIVEGTPEVRLRTYAHHNTSRDNVN